jgi:hypothetical protein
VVGDVVSKNHLVTVDNLDRFVVGDVLNSSSGGSGNLTARLHGHGLSKSSDDLEPVLVLHAFVLAGRFSGRPDVVVLSSGSSLEVESGLSESVNLVHGQFTLDNELEGLDLRVTSGSSSAPVSAGSLHSGLAALKRVLSPEGVEVLLGGLALSDIELVVSDGVLESDLHDVIMDSLSDGLGLEEGSFLGNSFSGSLGLSSKLSLDSNVSGASGNVSLSETESGVTFGTSGSVFSLSGHLGKGDSLSDGSGNLSLGDLNSEAHGLHVLSVGNLSGDSSSDGSSHGDLAHSDVSGDPFVESDLLESKSLLGFSLGNSSGDNGSSNGSLGHEENLLDSNVLGVSSLVSGNGGTENGVSVNSSLDDNSEFVLSSVSLLHGDGKSELSSLVGGGSLSSVLLGLLHGVASLIGSDAHLFGGVVHNLGASDPLLSKDGLLEGRFLGSGSLLLVVEVHLVGELADVEHLVSPSDGTLHLEVSSGGDLLGVNSSLEGNGGTSESFSHSLHSHLGVVVSDLSFLDLNVFEVDSNLKGLLGSLGISLSLNSGGLHLLGGGFGLDEEFGLVSKFDEVSGESLLLVSNEFGPSVDVLGVNVESHGKLVLVVLGGGNLPFGVESVVFLLLFGVLVNGNLDGKFESSSSLLVEEHLSVEFLVLGNSLLPELDGINSDGDGLLGDLVGFVVLFPGGGGEFLLDDNLSVERSGSELGGSSDLIEEDSSGDLNLGVLEVLGSVGGGDNSNSIVLSVLGLGSLSFLEGLVGSGDEFSGLTVEVISLLSVVGGLDVSGDLILVGFLSILVSLGHEGVLLGNELHGLGNNLLAVGDGSDHGLDGVLHLLDVSVTSLPFASGLSVGLSGKADKVESELLFLSVSDVSGGLSGDVDLGSLLSSDTEFLFSEGESGGSLGSFGEDSSSGFHSGSGGVVLHGLSEGNFLSLNSLLVDDGPVDS